MTTKWGDPRDCRPWRVRSPIAVLCGWINRACDRSLAKSERRMERALRNRKDKA